MERTSFETLKVYRLSEELADLIWDIAISWRDFPRTTIGKQLVKAADSIGANIAEGAGNGTYLNNKRFIKIARGSLYESKHWLRRSYKRKLLTTSQTEKLKSLLDKLSPMLNAYLKSIGTQKTKNNNH